MSLLQDVRYAFRQLRKSPAFTFTSIFSLALGIGATTAVFSVVYAVLMSPYPYRDPDRMAHLVLEKKTGGPYFVALTGPQLQQIRKVSSIQSATGEDQWNLTTTDQGIPEAVNAVYFTGNAFEHFGVPVLLGRGLIPADAPDGQDPQPVAVLGYKFWQRHYAGDPAVIGRKIQLVRKSYEIVGVVPARFTWGDADVYLPYKLTQDPTRQLGVNIRLKPGATRAAANSELQPLLEQFARETPQRFPDKGFHVRMQGLNEMFVQRLGKTLYLLFGAVALLLLIGCANVSILLLARGTARQHELAVRAAIGGSRGRILKQLLTESLTISLAGAALGILLAYQILAVIIAHLPEYSFPHEAAIQINLPVLLFCVALALLTGIGFGLSPALQLSRPELAQVIQSSTRKLTAGVRGKRTHAVLVGGQIALTLLLLATAGAAISGFLQLMNARLGYDPHYAMSAGVPVHDNTYKTWEDRSTYFAQLRNKIAELPEVEIAAISTNATPPNNGWHTKVELFGRPADSKQEVRVNLVSPEYFPLLRIPLLQGRFWSRTETGRGAHVAVINQTMARLYWPNGKEIGQQLRLPDLKADGQFLVAGKGGEDWFQIIGVVADALDDGLRNPVKPAIYVPFTIGMPVFTQILVRSRVPPLSILRSVRLQVQTVDPDQQVFGDVRNLEQWIAMQPEYSQGRLMATLFGAFSVMALLLAAVGLYSVVSYGVAQRTNEFGIRMALGAGRGDILRLVFYSTAISVGSGLAAGLLLSVGFNRLLASWAEGSSHNPVILLPVVLLLALVALLACLIPARRASSIDPITALRYE